LNSSNIKKGVDVERSLIKCVYKKSATGKEVASEYINFAEKAIERWKIALENPEVLFLEMEALEVVEMIKKHTREDQDTNERIEEVKEKLRRQIRDHIQKLSEDIRELSG